VTTNSGRERENQAVQQRPLQPGFYSPQILLVMETTIINGHSVLEEVTSDCATSRFWILNQNGIRFFRTPVDSSGCDRIIMNDKGAHLKFKSTLPKGLSLNTIERVFGRLTHREMY
jgi:hypothetical protein